MGNCCSRAGIGSAGSHPELLDSQHNGFEQATSPGHVAKKFCQETTAGRAALPDSSSSTTSAQADLSSSNEDFKDAACRNIRKVHASTVQDGCDSSHASTGLLSCMPILQKLARKAPPTVERPPGNPSSRGVPKSPGALRSRLISLQSSGSLIPAGLAQHSPGDEPSNEPSQDILTLESAASSPHIPHSSSGSSAPSLKPSYGPKSGAEDVASNSSTAGEPGLTLMVSSHSNSSHHGSPRSHALAGSSSSRCSRASSDSGHTAFASIPSSLFNSGSLTPDSMLSALSTTSSCISSSSSNGNHSSIAKARPASSTAAAIGINYTDEGAAGPVVAAAATAAGAQQLMQHSTTQQHQAIRQGLHQGMPQQQLEAAADNVGTADTAAAGAAAAAQAATLHQDRLAAPAAAAAPRPAADVDATSQQSPSSSDSRSCAAFGPQQADADFPEPQLFWKRSGWSFGSHSEQNLRSYMEDRCVAVDFTGHAAFGTSDRAGLFSVYDGHGGHQVAEFLAENVQKRVLAAGATAIAAEPLRVLGDAVQDAERQLLFSYASGDGTAAAGSTLCAVLLIDDKLHVAHVGDSRAVLARGTSAQQLTRDHKPACELEALRIKDDDPHAEITPDGYIYGELAVARAIGSAHLKRDPSKKALIATPEVATVQLEKHDDFVIVATDGLWDKISSNEAVSVARRVLCDTKDAAATSRALVERAQRCGSSDNISVVTLLLHSRRIMVPRSNSRLFKRPMTASPATTEGANDGST